MDSLDTAFKFKEDIAGVLAHLPSVSSVDDARRILPNSVTREIEKQVSEGTSVEEALKNIRTYISTIKDIKIYLPFEPTALFRETILDLWSDLKPHRYLEIIVDPSLIAGVQVSIDGTYYDHSVNSSINAILGTSKQA